MTASKLVSTGEAAKAIGVDQSTLIRWRQQQLVEPELVTAGGHARWDIDKLRDQLDRRAQETDS